MWSAADRNWDTHSAINAGATRSGPMEKSFITSRKTLRRKTISPIKRINLIGSRNFEPHWRKRDQKRLTTENHTKPEAPTTLMRPPSREKSCVATRDGSIVKVMVPSSDGRIGQRTERKCRGPEMSRSIFGLMSLNTTPMNFFRPLSNVAMAQPLKFSAHIMRRR